MGTALDTHTAGTALGIAGALGGVLAHRNMTGRAGRAGWTAHGLMATVMVVQAFPEYDRLGPAVWTVVLGLAAAWALGRPGGPPGARGGSPPIALDLYVMAVLTLLMPVAMPAAHHEGARDADWGRSLYALVLAVWCGARVALAWRRPRCGLAPAGVMFAGMAVMAFGA